MSGYFVSGTDTDVGKTFVSTLILRSWAAELGQRSVVGFKPLCCGGREDAEQLQSAGDPGVSIDQVNPIWLKSPAAPYAASLIENRPVEVGPLLEAFRNLRDGHERILVEGVGGWEVPVTRDYMASDLAKEIGLPVVVVVNNRLGALNHTILTVNAIQSTGLECAGIILNHVDEERDSASITNRALLEEILDVPILADVMHDESEIRWEQ